MTHAGPDLLHQHLETVRAHYEAAPTEPNAAARGYRGWLARYYNLLIPADASVLEIGCGSGDLLARLHAARKTGIDLSPAQIAAARARLPDAEFHVQAGEFLDLPGTYDYIIISDTLNIAGDVQRLFEQLHRVARPDTRLLVNFHNSLWRPLFAPARWLGLKMAHPQFSWLATSDVLNLHALRGKLDAMLEREGRMSLATASFQFLPHLAALDLAGWEDNDIFAHA